MAFHLYSQNLFLKKHFNPPSSIHLSQKRWKHEVINIFMAFPGFGLAKHLLQCTKSIVDIYNFSENLMMFQFERQKTEEYIITVKQANMLLPRKRWQ